MMQITEVEKSQLRMLLQQPQWKTIERFAELLCDSIKEDSPLRDNQWETLKTLLVQEGQMQGIRRLISEVYNHVA